MEGIDSGDNSSIFSHEPPFDFSDGDAELDDIFQSGVGWELLPMPMDEDDFEVLRGHLTVAEASVAPPAVGTTVERFQVAIVRGEVAAQDAPCEGMGFTGRHGTKTAHRAVPGLKARHGARGGTAREARPPLGRPSPLAIYSPSGSGP